MLPQPQPFARTPPPQAAPASLDSEALLRALATTLGQADFTAAALALVQDLARQLDCTLVGLGWHQPAGMRLVALSQGDATGHAELDRLFCAAQDEAGDQRRSLHYPETDPALPLVHAHAALARRLEGVLCTVPLAHAGRVIGALTLARRSPSFDAAETARIEAAATLLAPVLALRHELERSPWQRTLTQLRATLPDAVRRPGPLRRAAFGAAALFAAGLLAGLVVPLPTHIVAPATLEGAFQRTLVAPADGYLQAVHVRAGERVRAGQLLAELAGQDLKVEQRGLEAELAQQENALLSAQARGDRNAFIDSQGQAEALRARLELNRDTLARSQIRAPFAGVVIAGDLSQTVGAPVTRGDALFVLAPATAYRVTLEADESEIAALRPGQRGELILAALPGDPLPVRIERITPLAQSEPGKHFFAVHASLPAGMPALRPGMQGYARIAVDERPLIAGWLRDATHAIRLKLWAWGA